MSAVAAPRLVARALSDTHLIRRIRAIPLHVVAVGKAAAPMAEAFVAWPGLDIRQVLAIGTHPSPSLPRSVEWLEASHPLPDDRSEWAAERALAIARSVPAADVLVLLLSGGASALMCAPVDGITLDEKARTAKVMMEAGADIHALNTVRRHLSRVKGGRLAAACRGATLTLAISDVVGDAVSAIGSGPGVADSTTWSDALNALARWGGLAAHAPAVVDLMTRGVAGAVPDTPKPGDRALERAEARVIGSRRDAMDGAAAAASAQGYHPLVIDEPIVGEARTAARDWLNRARQRADGQPRPVCVVSAGETTVRVVGRGIGGRNLEFVLALAEPMNGVEPPQAAASVGTDGIDGTSGVAGGIVDSTTIARAAREGVGLPGRYLDDNDSFHFLSPLGDLIRLGRTDTNIGDLQVLLMGADRPAGGGGIHHDE